ncbi:hypothetical protein A1D24_01335 [Testudinibacter aquarius]|nr:hypothetical protein A1D24_01335 [Testudinibacter aquarius]
MVVFLVFILTNLIVILYPQQAIYLYRVSPMATYFSLLVQRKDKQKKHAPKILLMFRLLLISTSDLPTRFAQTRQIELEI